MLTLVTWLGGECWASPLQLAFIPLPTLSSWEGVNLPSLHLRRAEFFSTFFRAGWLHKLFGILHKRFFSFPLFINSIIYLYQNGFMDIHFILWVIIQYYLILLIQLWPLGALKSSCHTPFIVVFEQFVKLWYYINTPWNHWGGHGNPLQYSCLENLMDRGAWWATAHRVTKSQIQLKRLSIHGTTTTINSERMHQPPYHQRFLILFPSCSSSHTPYSTPRHPSMCFLSPEISWHFLVVYKRKWKWSRVWLFATSWTVAYQAPPFMGFSRQGYWSGLLFPSPGDLPDPGIEPGSAALQGDSLPPELSGLQWMVRPVTHTLGSVYALLPGLVI